MPLSLITAACVICLLTSVTSTPLTGVTQRDNPAFASPVEALSPIRLDEERLVALGESQFVFQHRGGEDFARALRTNPNARKSWEGVVRRVRRVALAGALEPGDPALVSRISWRMRDMALVYCLTGHERTGEVLRAMVMFLAEQDQAFWLNGEIRAVDPENPVGSLESGMLLNALGYTLNWAGDLFTPAERIRIARVMREQALLPNLRFLQTHSVESNWSAVIASGTYVGAKALGDHGAMDQARESMRAFLGMIFEDGSYKEPLNYFFYPLRQMSTALLIMDIGEARELVSTSALRKTLQWIPYYYYMIEGNDGLLEPVTVAFGDADRRSSSAIVFHLLAGLSGNGLGTWLLNSFHGDSWVERGTWVTLAQVLHYEGTLPEPLSPEEAGLPTTRAFEDGLATIRESWEPNARVIAMRFGDSRKFVHDRGNRNAITLAAHGEYILVAPHRASYRSYLANHWDLRSGSYNTVTIDNNSQYSPSASVWESAPETWEHGLTMGNPVSHLAAIEDHDDLAWFAAEAREAYPENPRTAQRMVVFVKDPGYYLVADRIVCSESRAFQLRWYLNNMDGRARISDLLPLGTGWRFERPKAHLDIQVFADVPLASRLGVGIAHSGYSYQPGGPNEGKWGSSLKLELENAEPRKAVTYLSVLHPKSKDAGTGLHAEVRFSGDTPVLCVRTKAGVDVFSLFPEDGEALRAGMPVVFTRSGDSPVRHRFEYSLTQPNP